MTATLCLLAFGAVMVYSASSPLGVLGGRGYGTGQFVRYLVFGALGLAGMHVLERRGLALLNRRLVSVLLLGSFALLLLVMVPGFGVQVNGARRWFARRPDPVPAVGGDEARAGPVRRPAIWPTIPSGCAGSARRCAPIAVVAGPACLLIVVEPDLGTALVVAFTIGALLVAAGMPLRYLALLAARDRRGDLLLALAQPYQRARLTSFLHPWAHESRRPATRRCRGRSRSARADCSASGLGKSVQKIFYLPEAQTDFILAVIGEELGVLGILGVVVRSTG